jgi:hypothetical protein
MRRCVNCESSAVVEKTDTDERKGTGEPGNERLDGIERALGLMPAYHVQFREEHKLLFRSQVLMQGGLEELRKSMEESRKNMDSLCRHVETMSVKIERMSDRVDALTADVVALTAKRRGDAPEVRPAVEESRIVSGPGSAPD